jgi:hypothetical protein
MIWQREAIKESLTRIGKIFNEGEKSDINDESKLKTAKTIFEAALVGDGLKIIMNSEKLIEEAKNISMQKGESLKLALSEMNPVKKVINVAEKVSERQFMGLKRELKIEQLKALEVYLGLTLFQNSTGMDKGQKLAQELRDVLKARMEEMKIEKWDYEMYFLRDCVKQALLIMDDDISGILKDLFILVFKFQNFEETGEFIVKLIEVWKRVPKQWYSRFLVARHISYRVQFEKEEKKILEELKRLQKFIFDELKKSESWQFVYGIVQVLGQIVLKGKTSKIRYHAYAKDPIPKDNDLNNKEKNKRQEIKIGLEDFFKWQGEKKKAIKEAGLRILYSLKQKYEGKDLSDNKETALRDSAVTEFKSMKSDKKMLYRVKEWYEKEKIREQYIREKNSE